MHHQLATSFVVAENRVLFIENTGARGPRLQDIGRIRERIVNWIKSTRGFREVQQGLTIFSPLFIPFPYSRIATAINRIIIAKSIRQWLKYAHFNDPILFTFLPTPLAQSLIRDIDPVLTVYYCVDDMACSSPDVQQLRPWEDILFHQADIVLVTAEAIRDRAVKFAQYVYSFPCGVDISKFTFTLKSLPDELSLMQRPIIGFIGALSEKIDQNLLLEMALKLPEATIALLGPLFTDISKLKKCNNIKILGAQPHDNMPLYVNAFDVTLIPYLVTPFNDSVYPCKLNEYLALGKPVVSTNIREVQAFAERYPDSVIIGYNTDDFILKVKHALNDSELNSKTTSENRIAVAKENTWEKRFEGIVEVINRHLLIKSQNEVSWKESLTKYYRRSFIRMVRTIAIICAFYLLVFNTPLFWFIGDQLVVRHLPRKVDAIVVFSGNGETTYRNDSYQRRALDAVRFYKQGYAPSIFLSSGKEQDLSEVDVIKLYLIDKGVDASAIHVLDKYPKSTYENVVMVNRQLSQKGVHSILFLTSPYHGRRALWTWRKQAPGIAVYTPAVVDTPAASPQWSASVDQIRVIMYEYAAITYNCIQGRL